MESTIEGPSECNNSLSIANFNANSWTSTQTATSRNPTYLFIAVEYVKGTNEYKIATDDFTTRATDFQEHVSPLDPNMSSAARYSPSANDSDIAYNGSVVVPQLITANTNPQLLNPNRDSFINHLVESNTSLDHIQALTNSEPNLLKDVVNNRYLLNQGPTSDASNSNILQLVPDRNPEQEVELLITDQTTGISYNVSTQEYLVERCLADEQHLLEALAPDPLLDTDLLTIDVSTLKSQLPDIVESPTLETQLITNSTLQQNLRDLEIKTEVFDDADPNHDSLRRSQRRQEMKTAEKENTFLNEVRAISDKPVESRAKATLPAHYLAIIKNDNGGCGVFARKLIPKQTQFGPLEGLMVVNDRQVDGEELHLLVESESGLIHRLDVSDDRVANWMCYVRRAKTYMEQNVVVLQRGSSLYYTTVVNILPKQELLVGYSPEYAKKHSLPLLQPIAWKQNDWACFECDKQFASSTELQTHLDKHDEVNKEHAPKLKKKMFKSKRKKKKKYQKHILECNVCKEVFVNPEYVILKKHLFMHGIGSCVPFEEKFTILNYHCSKCYTYFETDALLKDHSLQHRSDTNKITTSCSDCNKEFLTEEELEKHDCRSSEKPQTNKNGCKCPVCYKMFASQERIQRHMLVHGSEDSKPLKCETCNKRFLNNSALACHLKTHSGGKRMFECPMCNESFHHVLQLKVHVPLHCIDGKYTCPHCKKVFKEYSIIRKHIRAFHCERKHNCPQCSKPFPTLDKLRMHLLRHSDHREFLCADCGKQFKRKDKLKEHTKRMHSEERENTVPKTSKQALQNSKKFTPKVEPTDYHRFIYKCHACLVGFKRRGMLVNHLAKRHPDISPDSVPELNLPILRTTRDYYCQYCDKIYKSSSKRKAHILKNHPGQALPMSNRRQGSFPEVAGLPNPTFSQTVGSITTHPQACQWCHKQYASKAKLLQHQRKKHSDLLENRNQGQSNLNDQNVRVDQLVVDQQSFHRDFKVSDEDLLAEVVTLNNNRDDDQYYHIISIPSNEGTMYNQGSDVNHTADSRLYRLLTTGNGLIPPR